MSQETWSPKLDSDTGRPKYPIWLTSKAQRDNWTGTTNPSLFDLTRVNPEEMAHAIRCTLLWGTKADMKVRKSARQCFESIENRMRMPELGDTVFASFKSLHKCLQESKDPAVSVISQVVERLRTVYDKCDARTCKEFEDGATYLNLTFAPTIDHSNSFGNRRLPDEDVEKNFFTNAVKQLEKYVEGTTKDGLLIPEKVKPQKEVSATTSATTPAG